jgi:hypothetical protein
MVRASLAICSLLIASMMFMGQTFCRFVSMDERLGTLF